MVRVLHIADLHIGVENYGHFDVTRGMHTRLIDFLARFDQAIDIGLAAGVDLVLIAGDMFKNRNPPPRLQREFAERIRRLHAHKIPVLMVVGNHDVAPGRDTANSVSVYEGLQFAGVDIARKPAVYRYQTAHGALAIIAMPWIMREVFLSNNDALRLVGLSEQEVEILRVVETYIADQTDILLAEDPLRPIIVSYHGTVAGAVSGFEKQLTLGREIQLPQSVLTPMGVDYVALGHVHKHQCLRQSPPVVYSGSIERIDFGEINEAKGCVLVAFDGKQAQWEFVPLDSRPFVEIAVDVQQSGEFPMERVELAITRKTLTDAVVKIEITVAPAQKALVSERQIRQWCEQAGVAHVARIIIETAAQKESRIVDVTRTDDIPTPMVALEKYLRKKEQSEQELALILDLGRTIIESRDGA
ncbi:MAG: exonuclease SbcCD subunit D [Chloroflexi bacterium]|jgi:DNA repair protein SbcD/Mre11|nr:MAG: exonuclease SbcCD subunit D [Chloroflexota bacterium]